MATKQSFGAEQKGHKEIIRKIGEALISGGVSVLIEKDKKEPTKKG